MRLDLEFPRDPVALCLAAMLWAVSALGPAACVTRAQEEPPAPAHWVRRPSTPELRFERESAPTPVVWEPAEPRRFLVRPGEVWLVTPETAVIGWAGQGDDRREIHQTRLSLAHERGGEDREPFAWIQHVANTEVAILLPGDPRLVDPGPALPDSVYPWPNTCSVGVYDLDRALDLNLNDRMELPVRFLATVDDPAAEGLLLVEPDSAGVPRRIDPASLVGTVHFEEGILTGVRWQPGLRDPILEARYPPLYRCRFLARLGIRGGTDCVSCCELPLLLKRDSRGVFHPYYDRTLHRAYLERLRSDLELLQAGGTEPLSAPEQAALARAAAFFYLTGTGTRTREELAKALGSRMDQAPALLLLNRLDGFFLRTD